jgi:hypothetical protein
MTIGSKDSRGRNQGRMGGTAGTKIALYPIPPMQAAAGVPLVASNGLIFRQSIVVKTPSLGATVNHSSPVHHTRIYGTFV